MSRVKRLSRNDRDKQEIHGTIRRDALATVDKGRATERLGTEEMVLGENGMMMYTLGGGSIHYNICHLF